MTTPTDKSALASATKDSDPKVSEKSTKTELWAAYNELLKQLEGRSAEPAGPQLQAALANDPTRSLTELKLKIGQQLDGLNLDITNDLGSLQNVRRQIQVERTRLLETRQAEQRQLTDAITAVRQQWQREQDEYTREQERLKQEQARDRQREDEDYRYNLAKTRRSETDTYQEQHASRETALKLREQAIVEREQHLTGLETELAAWPKRLDDTVTQAVTALRKELEKQQATEAKENKLIHQHELAIATLKSQSIEQTAKQQSVEIDSLKRQVADAQRELKDMAVMVIEGRTNENRPQAQVQASPSIAAAAPSN